MAACRMVSLNISHEQQYKHGIGDLDFEGPIWNTSWCRVEYKKNPKGHGSTLEETRTDHFICSTVASTILLLCCVILKRRTTTKRRNTVFWKL